MSFGKVPDFLVNLFEADMSSNETRSYRFNSFLLDVAERQLLRDQAPVPLQPKAFDVLVYLVERDGHLVLKDELMKAIWPDSFVDEVNLPRTIHTLRRSLGEDDNGNKFIETVPTKGYRFVAEVTEVREPGPQSFAESEQTLTPFNLAGSIGEPQMSPPVTDDSDIPTIHRSRHSSRPVFFIVGFLSAITLIVVLSLNFRSLNSNTPIGVKTSNDEAYRLYLLGTALADKRNPEDSRKAIENLEQAVRLDPNFAAAYAALANAHSSVAIMGNGGNTTDEYLKAKSAIESALAIDDNLSEAHSYNGELKLNFEYDFAGAEKEHKRAVELDPNSAAAHRMYALLLAFIGKFDESIAEIKTAIDLEPASALNHKLFGQILFYARRYDESIAEGKRTVELDPDFPGVFDFLIGSYVMKGDNDQAFGWSVRQMEQDGDLPEEIQSWKAIYSQSGWRGIFERRLEKAKETEAKGSRNSMPLARLYIKLENREQAFIYLEKAYNQRSWAMISLKVNPSFDFLRSDPRYDELLKRVGFK